MPDYDGKFGTYFMGAATFCPSYPYNIHTMSAHPIVQRSLYEGTAVNHLINIILMMLLYLKRTYTLV